MRNQGRKNRKILLNPLNNQGFSLIEVLVCVAILAIISIPIFKSFGTSAILNSKAHYTQKVTAYAQKEMETIKSMSIAQYKTKVSGYLDEDGASSGTVEVTLTDEGETQKNAAPSDYPAELFETVSCTRDNIKIGNKKYLMSMTINPVPYSIVNDLTADEAVEADASDTNVYGALDITEVDNVNFPVVSDEINRFDSGAEGPGAAIHNLLGRIKESDLSGYGADEASRLRAIYDKTVKTVTVKIKDTSDGGIRIDCDVSYKLDGTDIVLTYNVYSGTYKLEAKLDGDGNFSEWVSGGNIFIFARAYADLFYGGSTAPLKNEINIINEYTGAYPLNVYLVRGYYYDKDSNGIVINKRGVNFDQVQVAGVNYYSGLPYGSADLTGELPKEATDGIINFYTNIKGKPAKVLTEQEMNATVGIGNGKLRCAEINIIVQEKKEDGTLSLAADITSTKIIK